MLKIIYPTTFYPEGLENTQRIFDYTAFRFADRRTGEDFACSFVVVF